MIDRPNDNKGSITNLSGSYHQGMESVNKEC